MNTDEDINVHTPLTPLEEEEHYTPTFSKKFLVEIDETCRSARTRLAVLLALEEGCFLEETDRAALKVADAILLKTSHEAREEASYWGGAVKYE